MDLLEKIAATVVCGRENIHSVHPSNKKGEVGVFELVQEALAEGVDPNEILSKGLMPGIREVGIKYSKKELYIPDMLMASRSMTTGMELLQPYFASGEVTHRGVLVIGTIKGDLHDLGKNMVCMMMEGAGYEVIDLGVNVQPERFVEELEKRPGCIIGMSALLTTTMIHMEAATRLIKEKSPETLVLIGGAPLNWDFCKKIGADAYGPDAQEIIEGLDARGA